MRLIVAGGGTGGHLFPALAIARAVKAEASEAEILFVGTRHGIEARIIPSTEFPIRFVSARGMRGTGLLNKIVGAFELPWGLIRSMALIREFRPDVVLGVGGYASGPLVAAAVIMGIPSAIQEQNSVMGTTNRILARCVDRIFTSWEETEPVPPAEKTIVTGNPVREDVVTGRSMAKNGTRIHILVFGGSRGARSINQAVAGNLDQLAPIADRIDILHQTGEADADEVRRQYERAGIHAEVREFIHDMGPAYQWADLVVCRSGASSLAELTAVGKPAIVVPYPYAIGDHQTKNAQVLAARGAVRVIPDGELRNGALMKEICSLVDEPDTLAAMAANSRELGRPQAARTIAQELLKLYRGMS